LIQKLGLWLKLGFLLKLFGRRENDELAEENRPKGGMKEEGWAEPCTNPILKLK
jgi:hypothetical protein